MRPSLVRFLLAGLLTGALAGVIVAPVGAALQRAASVPLEDEVAVTTLAQAAVISTLFGFLVCYVLQRRRGERVSRFVVLALGVATAWAFVGLVCPPGSPFGVVVTTLYMLVVAVTVGAFAIARERLLVPSSR